MRSEHRCGGPSPALAPRRLRLLALDKKTLSERDICTKYITPAIERAGWQQTQVREEVSFTEGRVIVRSKMVSRGKQNLYET